MAVIGLALPKQLGLRQLKRRQKRYYERFRLAYIVPPFTAGGGNTG